MRPPGFSNGRNLLQHFTQCAGFIIYFNPQCLEYLRKVPVGITFYQISNGLFKSIDCSKRCFVP